MEKKKRQNVATNLKDKAFELHIHIFQVKFLYFYFTIFWSMWGFIL